MFWKIIVRKDIFLINNKKPQVLQFVDVTYTFSSLKNEPARTKPLGDQKTVIHLFYSRHLIANKLYDQTSASESGLNK